MASLLCSVPVTVRLVGTLDDERLRQLEESVRKSVLLRLAQADQEVSRTHPEAGAVSADTGEHEAGENEPGSGGGVRIRTPGLHLLDTPLRPPDLLSMVGTAAGLLIAGLAPVSGTPAAAAIWPHVTRQVSTPRPRRRNMAPAWLYEPQLVKALQALGAREDQRAEVLRRVLDTLLGDRDTALGMLPKDDPTAEWAGFGAFMQKLFENGYEGYRALRPGFLVAFGALEVGTERALGHARTFYQPGSSGPGGSPLVRISVLGHADKLVHRDLAQHIQAAENALTAVDRRDLLPRITSVGTLVIRSNRNNPLALSWHSFGAAVDINPDLSPNVPGFPGEFVREVTDVDVLATLMVYAPGQDLDEARRQVLGSDRLAGIFRDESSLEAGLWQVAVRLAGTPKSVDPPGLRTAVLAAAAEGPAVHWAYGPTRRRSSKRHPVHGARHDALARLLFPPSPVLGPEPLDVWERRRHIVELLIRMTQVFEETFQHDKAGRRVLRGGKPLRVKPTAVSPKLGQIALHGFIGIPDRIVAALRAPGAGDLRWLGSHERATRDFMHFELRRLPPLYTPGPPAAPDTGTTEKGGGPR
ncbi:M15 family metallopeptidase [Streptomyces sp. NPDC055189]